MLKTLLVAIGLTTAVAGASAPAQTMFRPVAVVNDSAITGYDLAQRAQILVALGFPAASTDALRNEAMDRLIEDRLKMQEGKRMGIQMTQQNLDDGLKKFAQNVGQTPDALMAMMSAQGVTRKALDDLIASELTWQEVVRQRFGHRVEPGEAEIDAEIALMQQRTGASYRMAEIGLPLNDQGRNEAQTRALADKLYASLSAGGDFQAAAKAYSRAPSAARGGEIGWLPSDRMPPALADEVSTLQVGQVTHPIQVAGGIAILKVLEIRTEASSKIDPADDKLRQKVRDRLVQQQSARLAEGFLQELRRDALIEMR